MKLTKHWAAQLDDYVIDLAWSPDGTLLAAASAAGPITPFGASDGAPRGALPGHDGGTNTIAWQPGTSILASGGQDGSVKLWDSATGQHTATASLGRDWVEHLAWRTGNAAPILAAKAGKALRFLGPDLALGHALKDAPKTITALAWDPQAHAPQWPTSGG
jgi:WD40 repeat protein